MCAIVSYKKKASLTHTHGGAVMTAEGPEAAMATSKFSRSAPFNLDWMSDLRAAHSKCNPSFGHIPGGGWQQWCCVWEPFSNYSAFRTSVFVVTIKRQWQLVSKTFTVLEERLQYTLIQSDYSSE